MDSEAGRTAHRDEHAIVRYVVGDRCAPLYQGPQGHGEALRRPRRHAVERMLIGIAVLGSGSLAHRSCRSPDWLKLKNREARMATRGRKGTLTRPRERRRISQWGTSLAGSAFNRQSDRIPNPHRICGAWYMFKPDVRVVRRGHAGDLGHDAGVIQRAEHRDTQALHATKLDEILHVMGDARNELTRVVEEEPEEIENPQEPDAEG
jgi:hypothetical protein